MKKPMLIETFLGMCLLLGISNYAFSEDAEIKLNSNNGSTKFIIQDKDAVAVFSADSDGNTVIGGTATVAGSGFSVGGSTLVVINGRVGIGTTAPAAALDVNGAVRVGNYTTAAKPTAAAANKGAFIFDTTIGKPYVSNGTVWNLFDSDFDGDGITDAIDVDDNNAADATAVAADVLSGRTFYAGGAGRTGSVPAGANVSGGNGLKTFTITDGLYSGSKTGTANDALLAAGNIKSGITILGTAGTFTTGATAAAGDMLSGKTGVVNGSTITGNVPAGANVTGGNGLITFTITDGLYSGGKTAAAADANLIAADIKSGVAIFGKTGTFTGNNIPDTGQITGYATSDDASYASSAQPGYTDNGDGTTTDIRTGFMWAKDGSGAGCNSGGTALWEVAGNFCQNLTFAGFTDWRMPNIRELMSITDYGAASTAKINGTYFPNTAAEAYWAATTYVPNTAYAWTVAFNDGLVGATSKAGSYYIRCVRGGP